MRKFIKRLCGLYDIHDLTVGGHCGLCGKPIPAQIFVKGWAWGVCQECTDSVKEPPIKAQDKEVRLHGIWISSEK